MEVKRSYADGVPREAIPGSKGATDIRIGACGSPSRQTGKLLHVQYEDATGGEEACCGG